jgi:hypothetical protein
MRRKLTIRQLCLGGILAASGAAPAVADATFPPMHPGFWQSTLVMQMLMPGQPPMAGGPPRISYNCQSDASMAAAMKRMTGLMPGCNFDLEGGGGSYTMTTDCKNPGGMTGTISGKGVITLSGDTAMHMTETSVSTIQNMAMNMAITNDSKWIGACPAGAAPGDYGTIDNGSFHKEGSAMDPMKPIGQ